MGSASDMDTDMEVDTELHDAAPSTRYSERSSSDEPLLETVRRAKRPISTDDDDEAGSVTSESYKRRPTPVPTHHRFYIHELNKAIEEFTALGPKLNAKYSRKPVDLSNHFQIGASRWSALERDNLYRALARYGRNDHLQLLRCVPTKSEPEIEDLLRLLRRASNEAVIYDKWKCIRLASVPSAAEIPPNIDIGLEQTADTIIYQQDRQEELELSQQYGLLWLLDESALTEMESDDFNVFDNLEETDPLADDACSALELFDVANFLGLSLHVFMNSRDPQQNYITYAEEDQEPAIRLPAMVDLYRIIKTVTTRILLTAHFCALNRIRAEEKDETPEFKSCDISAALGILRQSDRHLRDKGMEDRVTMLRRFNVQPWDCSEDGTPIRPIDIDSAEWYLRRRNNVIEWRLGKATKGGRTQLEVDDYEKARTCDLTELNRTEKMAKRSLEDVFDDHEPFVTPLDRPDDNESGTEHESGPHFNVDSEEDEDSDEEADAQAELEEDYAEYYDVIASEKEAHRLRKYCGAQAPGQIPDNGASPPKKVPIRRKTGHLARIRPEWIDRLDYQPEWEQFHEPAALQILERSFRVDSDGIGSKDASTMHDAAALEDEPNIKEEPEDESIENTVAESEMAETSDTTSTPSTSTASSRESSSSV